MERKSWDGGNSLKQREGEGGKSKPNPEDYFNTFLASQVTAVPKASAGMAFAFTDYGLTPPVVL